MYTTYIIGAIILILCTLIPFLPFQHWTVRAFDFAKVQVLVLQVIVFVAAFFLVSRQTEFYILQSLLLMSIIYEISILYKYTPLYKSGESAKGSTSSKSIAIISANVYQMNTQFQRFIDLVQREKPDIVLTMESNKAWEKALEVIEKDYPFQQKVALENTYGMHLYSKIKFKSSKTNYFVADDIPSIECELISDDGFEFRLFGVHPPPPTPTEEPNSKERDGELLSVAKVIRKFEKPTIVVGDFNNVAWARSSVLFKKTSKLIDPRMGRGLISTFHAKYWLLRFPIDQMYHSADILVEELKTLENFNSDHLPLYCKFHIDHFDDTNEEEVKDLEQGEMEEVEEFIEEGKEEEGDREEKVEN